MEEIDIPDGILREETEDESALTLVETIEEIDIPAWYIPWVSIDDKLVHPSNMCPLSPLSPLTSHDGGDSIFSPMESADMKIETTTAAACEEHQSMYETPPASRGNSEPGDLFEAGPSKKRRVLAPDDGMCR